MPLQVYNNNMSLNLLGIRMNICNYESVIGNIDRTLREGVYGRYLCLSPAHPISLSVKDKQLKIALNNAWMVLPDGMSVVWAIRILGYKYQNRVYGPDLMLKLCSLANDKGYRIFLLGSTPKTLQRLKQNLLIQFPKLIIAGELSPPFRLLSYSERKNIVDLINRKCIHLLFVGLGCPKQEKWMEEFCPELNVPITLGVGAAFDFIAETKRQAPIWIQKSGFEWLYRFFNEPRRLFSRYLIYNTVFVALFAKQIIRQKLIQNSQII
jgi:N-acetylglucosaminyldiphosphoundecaprenol N-acetyl-beta-D-mannosaminyltransferase